MVSVMVVEGSGKAECRLCGNIIQKGDRTIAVVAYNISVRIHRDPRDCEKEYWKKVKEYDQRWQPAAGGD